MCGDICDLFLFFLHCRDRGAFSAAFFFFLTILSMYLYAAVWIVRGVQKKRKRRAYGEQPLCMYN